MLEQLEAFSDEGLGQVMGLLALQEVQHAPEALVPPVLLLFTYQREFRLLFRTLVLGLHCVCRLLFPISTRFISRAGLYLCCKI